MTPALAITHCPRLWRFAAINNEMPLHPVYQLEIEKTAKALLKSRRIEICGARPFDENVDTGVQEEKTKLLRRHLIEKVPISKICEEARLAPSLFHRRQEQLFVNAALALGDRRGSLRSQPPSHDS